MWDFYPLKPIFVHDSPSRDRFRITSAWVNELQSVTGPFHSCYHGPDKYPSSFLRRKMHSMYTAVASQLPSHWTINSTLQLKILILELRFRWSSSKCKHSKEVCKTFYFCDVQYLEWGYAALPIQWRFENIHDLSVTAWGNAYLAVVALHPQS